LLFESVDQLKTKSGLI